MARVISLTIYCKNGKGRYKAYFEETTPGVWCGIRSEKLPNVSFWEKLSMKNNRNKKSDITLSFRSKSDKENKLENFQGQFNTGNLMCPSCGNKSFIKCGVCGELTCWNDASPDFVCAVCGNSGQVSGHITDLNANSSNNTKKEYGFVGRKKDD